MFSGAGVGVGAGAGAARKQAVSATVHLKEMFNFQEFLKNFLIF